MNELYSIANKKYKAIIFDVDGTLYDQHKMHLYMQIALLRYYFFHISKLKELKIIAEFRTWWNNDNISSEILKHDPYGIIAKKYKIDRKHVQNIIEKWMYNEPLKYLLKCRDDDLYNFIIKIRNSGIQAVAYSDYPVTKKLSALEIVMDKCFCATDKDILCLKPNAAGIRAILTIIGCSSNECLFIGDRYEKDGKSAKNVNMDYLILPRNIKKRKHLNYLINNNCIDYSFSNGGFNK